MNEGVLIDEFDITKIETRYSGGSPFKGSLEGKSPLNLYKERMWTAEGNKGVFTPLDEGSLKKLRTLLEEGITHYPCYVFYWV